MLPCVAALGRQASSTLQYNECKRWLPDVILVNCILRTSTTVSISSLRTRTGLEMSCEGINDLAANHIVLSARIRLADEALIFRHALPCSVL